MMSELIAEHDARTLADLFERARRCNGGTPLNHPYRVASVELAAFMDALVSQGVTIYRIAKTLGVTSNAVKFRLARHGYIEGPSSQSWRYAGATSGFKAKEICKRGHALTEDNLWHGTYRNGRPRRQCRACLRERNREYRAAKRAAVPSSRVAS
jgi:hypothetical protein